jgi:hypothetical protein
MFFKKRKKVTLTFNTVAHPLIDLFPPTIGMKNVPSWWSDVSKNQAKVDVSDYMPTITSCPGITDLFKRAITVPLWMDFEIKYGRGGIQNISAPGASPETMDQLISIHHPGQWKGAFPGAQHLKLLCPWNIESDIMVPFLMVESTWHKNELSKYTIPPGVIEFKYQHGCHVNMFLHPTTNPTETLRLDAGMKFIHLVPLEDVDIEIKYKKITGEQSAQFNLWPSKFKRNYLFTRKTREENEA